MTCSTPFPLISNPLTNQLRDHEDEEDEEAADNIEDELEAMLEEEFPLEEDNEDTATESEKAASERLEMEIEERFMTDEVSLVTVTVQKHKTPFSPLLRHIQTDRKTCIHRISGILVGGILEVD